MRHAGIDCYSPNALLGREGERRQGSAASVVGLGTGYAGVWGACTRCLKRPVFVDRA